MEDIKKIEIFARKCYDDANCKYGGENYYKHIGMVIDTLFKNTTIFKNINDATATWGAAHCHDLIEDAKITYGDIMKTCGKDVADITLGVTDVPAENRLMRHLLTMGKTVKDYRAIILKLCDMHANASYSKSSGSSMYEKYVEEYEYRRPIFKKALTWYKNDVNEVPLEKLWKELDELHNYKIN